MTALELRGRLRSVELALWASLIAHAFAVATILPLLAPGLPGGGTDALLDRARYVAEHPFRWRLGWFPWHLSALANLWVSVALLRTRPLVPLVPAVLGLAFTILAVLLDQSPQLWWVVVGIGKAQQALSSASALAEYSTWESWAFRTTSALAPLAYTVMTVAWCFAIAPLGWSRISTVLTVISLVPLCLGPLVFLFPSVFALPASVVSIASAIGFPLLLLWFLVVGEHVARVSRPFTPHGRDARWKHHSGGLFGMILDVLCNSRFLRALGEALPVPSFRSDITDVIYVNYLVPAERLEALVPPGLQLQRVGPDGRYALFTFLTYRHGSLGPAFLGPLRKLFPSPVQSNWRTYVVDPRTGVRGIYFVTNAVSSVFHSFGARVFSEGMPMHPLTNAVLQRDEKTGAVQLRFSTGEGSAPDAEIELRPAKEFRWEEPWSTCFSSVRALLEYDVPQDRAMSSQPWLLRVTRQEISLGIRPEDCEPLDGTVRSSAAERIVGDAVPLCFRVPRVNFLFTHEHYDPLPETLPPQ